MRIIIETKDDALSNVKIEDGSCNLDDMVAIFFSVITAAVKTALSKEDAPEDLYNYLYEHFSAVFDLFFRKVFPDMPKGYFELSDAALLYAQDQIINDAEKNGKTFEEALADFEKKAKEALS